MRPAPLVDIYRRPVPLLAAGQVLAPHAQCDDGRLRRPAARRPAAGRSERLRGRDRPRRPAVVDARSLPSAGADLEARLFAATGGDDYALLAALRRELRPVKTFFTIGDDDQRASGRSTLARHRFRLISGGESGRAAGETGFELMNIAALSAPPMADRALAASLPAWLTALLLH